MTWRVGVVGYPISHSLSPRLQVEGLRLAGLEGTSSSVPVQENETAKLRDLIGTQFDALSVTMPLKAIAHELCDELDEVATRTGVVNSLLRREGRILGACTDGRGLVNFVEAQFALTVRERRVMVLGSGGAARGIVDALVFAGVERVVVLGRTPENVAALTDRYDNVTGEVDGFGEIDLLVNATPASGRGEVSVMSGVTSETVAVDIAYDPLSTPWRSLYAAHGCRTTNGLGMLAYQAALQMTWWWNVEIDGAALLEVIS